MVLKSILKPVVVAALLAAAGSSHAVITIYTTQASFLAAVSAPGVNTFSAISTTAPTASPLVGTAGSYGFTGTVSTTNFFGAAPGGNVALSTNTATDTITFGSFTGGVRGAGGNFFGSGIDGGYLLGNMLLTALDASGATATTTIANATTTSFIGFVSNVALSSFTVTAVQPAADFVWPTVDNLTLAAPVPEPGTYAMLFAGLGVIGFMARRRRG